MIKRFFSWCTHHLVPAEHNSYRPNALSRDVLLVAVTFTCVVEGFLVASLFIQAKPGSFAAAVIESALVSLTNEQRTTNGDSILRVDPTLTLAAQAKANDMAAKGYFSHVSPSGEQPWKWFKDAGYDYAYAGENLAIRFFESADVVEAWMNSPGHRANILKGAYQDIGIGIAEGEYEGQPTTFVVQFFGTSRSELGYLPSKPVPVEPTPAETVAVPVDAPVHTASVKSAAAESTAAKAPIATTSVEEDASPVVAVQQPAPAAIVQPPPVVPLETKTQIPGSVARFLSAPRTISLFLLGSIIAFLLLALGIAIFVRIHIQPLDLLASGAVVAVFTIILFSANLYFLTGAEVPESAAVILNAGR